MKRIIILTGAILLCQIVYSQYTITQGGTVNTCSGTYTAGSYVANQSYTFTICGTGLTDNNHVSIFFTAWDVPSPNLMCVYDGPDATYDLLGCYDNSNWGADHAFTATPANLSGCITMVFTPSNTTSSWSATLNCIFSCQPFLANLDYTIPAVGPDGIYTDICLGEPITFSGSGDYYMNDTLYHQEDGQCTFTWFFGDGTSATGQTVTHTYTTIEGFNISLVITDQNDCVNLNELDNRVRVSTIPNFVGTDILPDDICIGETVDLHGVVNPAQGSNEPDTVVAGMTYLPDGNGASYSTSLIMTIFEPGQFLEDINDLLGICVNMEHSYLGDLVISITCPDGTQVILEDQGGGGTFLGEPIDVDDPNQVGVGWTYCFTPTATNGTLNDNAGGSGTSLPAGDYGTYQPISSLVGCPLNGNWIITVTDNWSIDDGFIFWWGLNFAPELYPTIWYYIPGFPVADQHWTGNGITPPSTSDITVEPTLSGTLQYTFTATDEYGCSYDTTLSIIVREPATYSNFAWDCIDSTQTFYIEFDMSGGNGPYTVVDSATGMNVGTIIGGDHFFWEMPSGTHYNILIGNENNCEKVHLFGFQNCACYTYSGTMDLDELIACEGNPITAINNGDEFLTADDLFEFIIHDGSGTYPYTALATGNDPTFLDSEVPGIVYGQTYYIAAVAGYEDMGNLGHVDPLDTCYSQSMGVPVIWMENPTAIIPLTSVKECSKTIQLTAVPPLVGNGGWYCPDCESFITVNNTVYTDPTVWVSVPDYGQETFIWSVYNWQCVASDTIVVNFLETPTAYAGQDKAVCGTSTGLEAVFSVSTTGEWTPQTNVAFDPTDSPTAIVTVPDFGTYTFTWKEENDICNDNDKVKITFIETPVSDAGLNDTVCGTTYTLVANNTFPDSVGFGFWYYTGGGNIIISDMYNDTTNAMYTGPGDFLTTVSFVWYERNEISIDPVCELRDTVLITFASVPSANAGVDDEICGSFIQLEADMLGAGLYTSITWSVNLVTAVFDTANTAPENIGVGSEQGTHDPNGWITITSLGAFGDSAIVTVPIIWMISNLNCKDVDTVEVTFNQKPDANAGLDDSICGLTYQFKADRSLEFSTSSGWSTLDGPITVGITYIPADPIDTNSIVNVPIVGTYWFIWVERNPEMPMFCIDRDTVKITFLEKPNPDAGNNFNVCGKYTQMEAIPTPGTTGAWQQLPGVQYIPPNSPTAQCTVNVWGPLNMVWCETNSVCSDCDMVTVTFYQDLEAEQQVYDPADYQNGILPWCEDMFPSLDANPYTSIPTAHGQWIDIIGGTQIYSPADSVPTCSVTVACIKCFSYTRFPWNLVIK
ncbi:MAG: proprotein convertase P-domain-containing protein [Bacteroidia bacterium]|nr:proprotein convertase P-domain-containing protein [Bacteroidia bacterium]